MINAGKYEILHRQPSRQSAGTVYFSSRRDSQTWTAVFHTSWFFLYFLKHADASPTSNFCMFVCFSTCYFSVALPGAGWQQEVPRGSQALWWVLFVCLFFHVSIMCPQNSRKGSCVGGHVMDFSWSMSLISSLGWKSPLTAAQCAVNTFLACRDA